MSCFLLLLLHLRQICNGCCTRTRASARNYKSCTLTNFCLRDKLVPRHCASAHLSTFCQRDRFPATYQTCTATLRSAVLNKHCTMTAKTRAIPSLHRDNFSRGASTRTLPGCCRRVTLTNYTAGPLGAIIAWYSKTYKDN